MATVTIHQICDAIETTLGAATSLVRHQTFDDLSEGMQDYPTLQVYPEANLGTDRDQETDRTAFMAATGTVKHRQKEYVIHADLFARQRSNLAEDMAQLVETVDEIEDILEAQVCPLFGLTVAGAAKGPIRSFRWSWQRVIFEYGDPVVKYMGARFILTLVVF